MFSHSTNSASFFPVLVAALIFLLYLAGIAVAQGNTSLGTGALQTNTTGSFNTAIGLQALFSNTTGSQNTASGVNALLSNSIGDFNTASGVNALAGNTTGSQNTASGGFAIFSNTTGNGNTANGGGALSSNTTGSFNTGSGLQALFRNTTGDQNTASGVNALDNNTTGSQNTASGLAALANNTTGNNNTAIGFFANVSVGNLTNATAIGAGAIVNASDKIRLGDTQVTMIEGQVAFTASSDKSQKENFQPVNGEAVLGKIRGFELSSWNFIGHDPKKFRHYGPMAQDFFAAFGHDGIGQIGSETTINSGDMAGILMIAVQALEKRTAELKQKEAQIAILQSEINDLKAKHAYFETVAARLDALELRKTLSVQITADVMRK
jgi:trimeric autotransporter adhesin